MHTILSSFLPLTIVDILHIILRAFKESTDSGRSPAALLGVTEEDFVRQSSVADIEVEGMSKV